MNKLPVGLNINDVSCNLINMLHIFFGSIMIWKLKSVIFSPSAFAFIFRFIPVEIKIEIKDSIWFEAVLKLNFYIN